MSATLIGTGADNFTDTVTLATRFLRPVGAEGSHVYTAESGAAFVWIGGPGRIVGLQMNAYLNTRAGATQFWLRVNGADGQSFTIPGNGTGTFSSGSGADTVQDGDVIAIRYQNAMGATGLIRFSGFSYSFYADVGTVCLYSAYVDAGLVQSSSVFTGLLGYSTGLEADTRTPVGAAGTFSKFVVEVTANTLASSSCVVTMKLNGTATAMTVTISPGSVGTFTATGTITVAVGDEVYYSLSGGGGGGAGSITIRQVVSKFTSASAMFDLGSFVGTNTFPSTTVDTFFRMFGRRDTTSTTESNVTIDPSHGFTLSRMRARIQSSTTTAPFVITTRENGADGNLLITVPAATNGNFSDFAHTDDFIPGLSMDIRIGPTVGDANVDVHWIMMSATGDMIVAGGAPQALTLLGFIGQTLFGALKRRLGAWLKMAAPNQP